jgi:hypothetical protein
MENENGTEVSLAGTGVRLAAVERCRKWPATQLWGIRESAWLGTEVMLVGTITHDAGNPLQRFYELER